MLTLTEFENLIKKENLVIRYIPPIINNLIAYNENNILRAKADKNFIKGEEVTHGKGKFYQYQTKIDEAIADKFVVAKVQNTGTTVKFKADIKFNSLEEIYNYYNNKEI